jgi:hypothetical protein
MDKIISVDSSYVLDVVAMKNSKFLLGNENVDIQSVIRGLPGRILSLLCVRIINLITDNIYSTEYAL